MRMRFWKMAGLSSALLAAGCATPCRGPSAALLRNAVYTHTATPGRAFHLRNGAHHEPAAPEAASEIVVRLHDRPAYGDLNGDGKNDAALIVTASTGGSGTFYDLTAAVDVGGVIAISDSVFLGDRVIIRAVRIDRGIIVVNMVTHGPEDAMPHPTLEETRRFALTEKGLVQL